MRPPSMLGHKFDRNSPIPLWRQIYASLREQILDKTLPPGSRVPSEIELARLTGASRATIRQALNLLERERLVYRAGTKGVFVSERRVEQSLSILKGLSEKLEELGLQVTSRIVLFERRHPDLETQQLLALQTGDEVYVLERVRLANNVPVALQTAYLPAPLYPRLEDHDLTGSLTKLIRTFYGHDLASYKGSMEVMTAGARYARLLGVSLGSPLLLLDGVTYNLISVPLRRTLSVYRCDCFRFTIEGGFGLETKGQNLKSEPMERTVDHAE